MNRLNFIALIFLSGCMVVGDPPIIDRSVSQKVAKEKPQKKRLGIFRSERIYVVRKGDTLYSIAWKKGLSYGFLAEQNNIAAPFIIYPGQRLKLSGFKNSRVLAKTNKVKPSDRTSLEDEKSRNSNKTDSSNRNGWVWPLNIRPSLGFSKNNKGVDYTLVKSTWSSLSKNRFDQALYRGYIYKSKPFQTPTIQSKIRYK